MLWPILTLLAVAALFLLEVTWRRRLAHARKEAQEALAALNQDRQRTTQQTQEQQEAIFNSMADGVLLLDQEGRIQMANQACTSLLDITGPVRGKTLLEAVRLHELPSLVQLLGSEKQVLGFGLKIPGPPARWLEVNGTAINGGSERQGTVLVFHDLTRLKQLESTRKDFVANVSHELRTPLSLIKGYAETLLNGAKEDPELSTKFLHTIDRNAERLRRLIEDLLTISELESGRLKMNLQPVALQPVIESIFSDLRSRAEARRVTLINETPELQLHADPGRLEQVLGNLVDNAIKYGREGGAVRIQAHISIPGEAELSVQTVKSRT